MLHLDGVARLLTGALMLRDLVEEAEGAGRILIIGGAGAHAARLLTRVPGPDVAEGGGQV